MQREAINHDYMSKFSRRAGALVFGRDFKSQLLAIN
jgi:hypothetical protein